MRARFEKIGLAPGRSFAIVERRLARFDAPWHFHPEIELTLIEAGAGRRFVGESIEPFAAGDLVLLGSNLPHFWHTEGRQPRGRPCHSIVVQFAPDFLGAEFWLRPEATAVYRLLAAAARGLHISGPGAGKAAERLRRLVRLDGLPAVLELLAILHGLAEASRQHRPLASAAYVPSLDRASEGRLARVYAFLLARFRGPVTLAQIAREASMTPAGFSRHFKRMTGRNVSVFLNELRVGHAARLLSETSRGIAEIAVDSGFATLSNFNRRFRERMACSPRDYRRALVG